MLFLLSGHSSQAWRIALKNTSPTIATSFAFTATILGMDDEARLKRVCEILDTLKSSALTPEEIDRLERELDQYVQVRDPNAVGELLPGPPAAYELAAFAERLKNRKGTKMPDFVALYRRRADLDGKT